MASSRASTQLNVKKLYEFVFKGEKHILEEDEARYIKELFVRNVPDNGTSSHKLLDNKVAKELLEKISDDRLKPRIPEGYREIGRDSTEPRAGRPGNPFVYYEHPEGNYGFIALNQLKHGFCRLGNIRDPHSIIGKCVRTVPINKPFGRTDIKRLGIVTSSEYRKAVCDVLKLKAYFADSQQLGRRPLRNLYVRTDKTDGLEVDNNHGFPKEVEAILQPNK